ncbi:hypothetical protein QWY86_09855 [Pedobacter aquatilis]|uniref:hypothetical protein n=1 Tax=Pedobacter aquatilis TaxID=351343 RepID=UPI0025B33AEE|nr:hypothetical protein [Pedobacter aquatilis]MDN3586972.1 hypothetical protein [Pedobacter aquatilis]
MPKKSIFIVKIYTVNDLSKTNIRSVQNILYEYISADSIMIIYDKSVKASLDFELKKRLIDYKTNTQTAQSQKITVSGNNLAFGYRVFELGKTKIIEKRGKIKDTKGGGGLKELKVLKYNFAFNDYELAQCIGKTVPINDEKLKACGLSAPVDLSIRNFSNTDATGKPLSKELKIRPDTFQELRFSYKSENKLISDNIKISYSYNPKSFFLYMSDNSKVEIRSTLTPLKILNSPTAAGW